MSLRRHQLWHDYLGCARLLGNSSSSPHNGVRDVKGVVGPVWRLSPNKIPTEPILAVEQVNGQGPWVKGQGTTPGW